jgi:hypothetical protein
LHSAQRGTGTLVVSQLGAAMLATSSFCCSLVSLYISHFEAESLSGGLVSQNQQSGAFGFSCDTLASLSVCRRGVRGGATLQ